MKPLITKPGFYPSITCEQYFAEPCPAPALTNSGIKLLNSSCPAKFAWEFGLIKSDLQIMQGASGDKKSLLMGNLVHRLALGKGSDYVVSPYDAFRSDEAKAWKAGVQRAGKMPVKQAEFDDAQIMAARIREAIEAETRGHPYETEVVIAWQMTIIHGVPPIWCRAMIDVWCPALNLALDVKTCADASDKAVMRAFANGYAGQHAWYADGIEALSNAKGKPRFGFLFVEKEAPFLARFAEPSEGFRHGASIANERAAVLFARCLHRDDWPGYAPLTASPPSWWLNEIADYELEEAAE